MQPPSVTTSHSANSWSCHSLTLVLPDISLAADSIVLHVREQELCYLAVVPVPCCQLMSVCYIVYAASHATIANASSAASAHAAAAAAATHSEED